MRQVLLITLLFAACSGPDSPKQSGPDDGNANTNNDDNGSTNNLANNSNNESNTTATNACEPGVCDDADACTVDTAQFDSGSCETLCSFAPVNDCTDGDGCCPEGCTGADDDDCVCEPMTCEALGRTCGADDDGCGASLDCGTCDFDADCTAEGACEAAPRPTCAGIGDCPVGYNHCSSGECVVCLTPPDCGDGEVCSDQRCEPSPDCAADPNACPQLYTCFEGACVPDETQTCDPNDPMSCPMGSFCDPATTKCSGGNGMGCGLCNPDCTCDNGLSCDGFLCEGCDVALNNCPDGQACLPLNGTTICFPL